VGQDNDQASGAVLKPVKKMLLSPLITASPTDGGDAVVTLLRYSRFITELNASELRDEFVKIDVANRIESSNRGVLKMVVLLSLPQATFHNEEKAGELLNIFINDNTNNNPALREYAHLLLAHLKQRKGHMKLYDDLHLKLQSEREQRKKLQRKLEDLKSIEKSITKRQKEAGG
jgi:hypothetical protein